MFHLLTDVAEQENYYVTNVLKKPQRVNVHQFVHCVEQLNAYIAQMPCFYYSPHANASTKPKNVLFTEAELGAHVLCMCPLPWQDQYNMTEKGMTPMDMRSLLTSLEAIEHVYTYEEGKLDNFEKSDKSSNTGEKETKRPSTESTVRVPKKIDLRSIANSARSMGAHIPRTTLVIALGSRKMEQKNPVSAPLRKMERKTIP
jgi:hypothetical protein